MKASLLILPMCLSFLTACNFESSTGTATPAAIPTVTGPEAEGNSSGGGGFGDESSMQLLKWSQQIVSRALRQTNSNAFEGLPQGWSAERLAKLIESVRPEPNKVVYRYNRELMFDYVVPKEGEPYLIATSLFFRAFAAVPVASMREDLLEPYLRMLRMRLLHETAHVLGIGTSESSDYKARVFAYYISNIFWTNNVACVANDTPADYPSRVQDYDIEETLKDDFYSYMNPEQKAEFRKKIESLPYVWVLNRGFGFGLQMRKHQPKYVSKNFFLDKLLAGTPTSGANAIYYAQTARKPGGAYNEFNRYYDPSYFGSENDIRVDQQYYKALETKDGWARFQGLFTSQPTPTSPNTIACSSSETFRLPQSLSGSYDAAIEFSDSCANHDKPVAQGTITVKCVESFTKMNLMHEFYGDQNFKDPELLSLIPANELD